MRRPDQAKAGTSVRGLIRLVVFSGLLSAIAFAAAGTTDWPMMWAFLVFHVCMMVVNVRRTRNWTDMWNTLVGYGYG